MKFLTGLILGEAHVSGPSQGPSQGFSGQPWAPSISFPARLKAPCPFQISRDPPWARRAIFLSFPARLKAPGARRGPQESESLPGTRPPIYHVILCNVCRITVSGRHPTGGPACKCVAEFTRPAPWSGGCGCRGHCGFAVSECEHGRQTRQRCLWCNRYFV